jgi:hypothetical protein
MQDLDTDKTSVAITSVQSCRTFLKFQDLQTGTR